VNGEVIEEVGRLFLEVGREKEAHLLGRSQISTAPPSAVHIVKMKVLGF
jgi:hypothetical protein